VTFIDPIHVLLVDASSGHLRELEPRLQSAGLRTFVAQDCQQVLAEARLGRFDVVVIGESLVDVDNMDLPHILRAVNTAGGHLPIIWMPVKFDSQQIMAALELNIDIILDRQTPLPIFLSYLLNFGKKKRYADGMLESVIHLRHLLEDQSQQMDQLKDNNSQLREMSMTDPLTGLFNARYMRQWLTQSFAYAVRYNKPFSVIFLDLDHFKWINDCYGHLTGDKALQIVGRVLKNSVRDSDLAARYAGDEFLLALPDTPADQLPVLAQRINEELRINVMESGGEEFHVSCSMGSATYPEEESIATYQELLNLADQALYAAKRAGREQLAMWHELPSQHHHAVNVNQTSFARD
jgi:diguanylate cyclase (GGDEF)-like protein